MFFWEGPLIDLVLVINLHPSNRQLCKLNGLSTTQGVLPDLMHVAHLALFPDILISVILNVTDTDRLVQGNSRDARLQRLWQSYRDFCENTKVTDRATRKFFLSTTLRGTGDKYMEVSQKVLSATAARYMLFWLSSLANQFATKADASETDLLL